MRSGPGPARRVLLVSSNGSGMGHLTRLLAMGRRAEDGSDVHVLSMSSAVPLAAGGVLPYQYVPSADDMGISARRWNTVLHRRLGEAVRRLRPHVLVFDGTYPYRAVAELKDRFPDVRLVWSRRPLWRPGLGTRQLGLTEKFDLVLEPGELAASYDRGLTAGRPEALRVRPVTLLDQQEVLSVEGARDGLGLDREVPTVLVTLGAGSWHDVDSDVGAVVAGLRLAVPDAQICLVRPTIARSQRDPGKGIRVVSAYPLSRYLRAFDLVVTAAGYNTFHESVALARPSGFVGVPAQMDDQTQRDSWAEDVGAGLDVHPREPSSVARLGALLKDPGWRIQMSRTASRVWPGNGARDAMAAVEAMADGASVGDLRAEQSLRDGSGAPG